MLRLHGVRIVQEVVELASIDSTNTYALDSGRIGLLVIASEQTSGRGRMGRSWFSPRASNAYMTLTVDNGDSRLPIVIGTAVREALSEVIRGAVPVEIKWPNDILAGGRKICGILCESRRITAIGMGINVNQRQWPQDLEGMTISLAEILGGSLDIEEIIERVIISVDRWYSLFIREGFCPVRENFLEHGLLKSHEIFTEDGLPCSIRDIDMQGRLILDVSGAIHELVSGSIRLIT
jgi:BirA family transcriptional regulator, biotin operon repressor / biotin---[acetyl-CoA-carboxylase] ligase